MEGKRKGAGMSKIVEAGQQVLLVTGGRNGTSNTSVITDTFEIMDKPYKWRTMTSTLALRNHCQYGRWIFGGIEEDGNYSRTVYKLDEDYKWENYFELSRARANCGVAKIRNLDYNTDYYYVVGGDREEGDNYIEKFDKYGSVNFGVPLPSEIQGDGVDYISPFGFNGTLHLFDRYGNIFRLKSDILDEEVENWEKVKTKDEGLKISHKILIIQQHHIFGVK